MISVPSTTGTKTQVLKNPLFDTFMSIPLAQTFKSISCSETSVANRVSTGHEDINCLINNILKDLPVLRVSEEWERYQTKRIASGIPRSKSYWEGNSLWLHGRAEVVYFHWMQHLVIEIRQGDAITVTRTRRLAPNRHLGISTNWSNDTDINKSKKRGYCKALTWRCIHSRANCSSSLSELNN